MNTKNLCISILKRKHSWKSNARNNEVHNEKAGFFMWAGYSGFLFLFSKKVGEVYTLYNYINHLFTLKVKVIGMVGKWCLCFIGLLKCYCHGSGLPIPCRYPAFCYSRRHEFHSFLSMPNILKGKCVDKLNQWGCKHRFHFSGKKARGDRSGVWGTWENWSWYNTNMNKMFLMFNTGNHWAIEIFMKNYRYKGLCYLKLTHT